MQEVKLDSLIEKIKKEGIVEAKRKEEEIICQAKAQAQRIISEAEQKAQIIVEEANQQANKLKSTTNAALNQAGRDLVLTVRDKLQRLCESVFKSRVSGILEPAFLQQIILKLIENWSPQKSIEVFVSESDKQKLEQLISFSLKKEAKNTIEIKVNKNIRKGFFIGVKGEDVYYDFSDESILQSLKEFLNSTTLSVLKDE